MTASNYLSITAIVLIAVGWATRLHAEGDVTIVSPPAMDQTPSQNGDASGGTPVIHKSAHKKKSSAIASTPVDAAPPASSAAANPSAAHPVVRSVATAPSKTAAIAGTKDPNPAENSSSVAPTVETGLPVARHIGTNGASAGVFLPGPTIATLPGVKSRAKAAQHQPLMGSLAPVSPLFPGTSSNVASYTSTERSASPSDDFVFTNFSKKAKNIYPWKRNIITTEFWIGEPGSDISPTDNVASAWDANWRTSNRGTDSPNYRNGYAPADHAATVNPFYVALPFNDLAYPDKAREWLPPGWHRASRDGKQVSACKDRWVQIKNQQGDYCYAQWEDVGPLVSDHAEYVFGNERPDTLTRAGLDVSPAVAQYLRIGDGNRLTSWRFVDDEDVPPGQWLKYDEEALLFSALHDLKNKNFGSPFPVQRLSEPINDPSNVDSNKKKVGAAKG